MLCGLSKRCSLFVEKFGAKTPSITRAVSEAICMSGAAPWDMGVFASSYHVATGKTSPEKKCFLVVVLGTDLQKLLRICTVPAVPLAVERIAN